jgi:pyruvate kinase
MELLEMPPPSTPVRPGRYHAQTIGNVREALKQSKRMCALALDTKGPEIRTG